MSLPAYEREPYRTELSTTVIETGVEGNRPFAVLDDTILYPEGGGQPADHGTLAGIDVLDVQKRDAAVRHYLASPVPPGPADVRLDWGRRFDHMQQHTGQHLLTAVAQDRFGWETTSFHLGELLCDIEVAVPSPGASRLAELEEAVAGEVRAARPVTSRRVPPEELGSLNVRTRGLPEGFTGEVRLVEIAGVDLNTCGGTHLRSTAEIEVVKLLGTESIRGGTRLLFACGGRARRRLQAHEERAATLRGLLGASDAELVGAVEARLSQLRTAERRLRGAEEELAEALVLALVAEPGPLVSRHLPGHDMGFLQKLARAFSVACPSKLAFLTAEQDEQAFFALGAGAELTFDLSAAGKEVASILGGRGGGSGRVFQGKAGSLGARDAAGARLRELAP